MLRWVQKQPQHLLALLSLVFALVFPQKFRAVLEDPDNPTTLMAEAMGPISLSQGGGLPEAASQRFLSTLLAMLKGSASPWRLPVLLASLCLACTAPAQLQQLASQGTRPLTADGITVWFNHRATTHYLSPLSGLQRPGDDLEALLLEAIETAQVSVDMAVQEISLPAIADALIARHRAGVAVRVVLEDSYADSWSQQDPAQLDKNQRYRWRRLWRLADRDGDTTITAEEARRGDAVRLLREAGVPLLDDRADGSAGSDLMHHKFVVVDGRQVITGSANFSSSGIHGDAGRPRTRGNVNHMVAIDSQQLAAAFREQFEQLWGDGPGGAPDSRFGRSKLRHRSITLQQPQGSGLTLQFSPHGRNDDVDGLDLIAAALDQARERIDLALFVFSAQPLADALQRASQRGVTIRLLMDPGFLARPFSEALDLLGLERPDHRCVVEPGNRPWAQPLLTVGSPRLARGDKLHHKFAVIDGETVITGSFNWSDSAAYANDETLLLIRNARIAAQFSEEFQQLWRTAQLGLRERDAQRLKADRRRCGLPDTF